MTEKRCNTCKFELILIGSEPCRHCLFTSRHPAWQPKEPEKRELTRCPFCGSSLLIYEIQQTGRRKTAVYCSGCGARGPYGIDEEGAAMCWNRRVDPPVPDRGHLIDGWPYLIHASEIPDPAQRITRKSVYTQAEEIDRLRAAIRKAQRILKKAIE